MSNKDYFSAIGKALYYILVAAGLFLFCYRMYTGTAPGTPVELHKQCDIKDIDQ